MTVAEVERWLAPNLGYDPPPKCGTAEGARPPRARLRRGKAPPSAHAFAPQRCASATEGRPDLPHGRCVGVEIPPVLTDELRAALHPDERAFADSPGTRAASPRSPPAGGVAGGAARGRRPTRRRPHAWRARRLLARPPAAPRRCRRACSPRSATSARWPSPWRRPAAIPPARRPRWAWTWRRIAPCAWTSPGGCSPRASTRGVAALPAAGA